MYRLHYLEKIRPEVHSAALIFGSALDSGLNEMLKPTGKTPEDEFEKIFTKAKIAGKECYIPTYTGILYPTSNFDSEILISQDFEKIYLSIESGEIKIDRELDTSEKQLIFYDTLKQKRKSEDGFNSFSEEEKKYYNLCNWLVSYRRGLLMLSTYRKNVLPNIIEVLSSQEVISLKNEDGDEVTGIVDLVANFKDHGVIIFDNKSSSIKYAEDSVKTSKQLGLYTYALGDKYKTNKAGFIVLQKQVKKNRVKTCKKCGFVSHGRFATCNNADDSGVKRCNGEWSEEIYPEIKVQILINEVDEDDQARAIQRLDLTNTAIQSKVFERNLKSCDNQYGARCVYYGLCHGNSMAGLVDLKEKK